MLVKKKNRKKMSWFRKPLKKSNCWLERKIEKKRVGLKNKLDLVLVYESMRLILTSVATHEHGIIYIEDVKIIEIIETRF